VTLVLDLSVDIGLSRAIARSGRETRFEQFDRDFHERLRQAFLAIVRDDPARCALIDASGVEDEVASRIQDAVVQRSGL
jgi:dTMP kinase